MSRYPEPVGPTDEQLRAESLTRLTEDIRKALIHGDKPRAAKLGAQWLGELADDDFIRSQGWPICLECHGTGEVVDPQHTEKKTACPSAPKACRGNRTGRMSPESYAAYLRDKLEPLKTSVTETVPTANDLGEVPRLPADVQGATRLPYLYSREDVIALNPIREAQGLPPLTEGIDFASTE